MAQRLQRWLRICWKRSTFWKACNKQNTWECWTCMGCNQLRSAADSARTRFWSGHSKNCCVRDWTKGPGVKHVVAKFVPWLLLPEEKEHHATVANDSIQTATSEPDFLKKVTTRDELWVYRMIWKWRPSCPHGSCLLYTSDAADDPRVV